MIRIQSGVQFLPLRFAELYRVRNAGDAVPDVLDKQNPLRDTECEEVTDGESFYHAVSLTPCRVLFKGIQTKSGFARCNVPHSVDAGPSPIHG